MGPAPSLNSNEFQLQKDFYSVFKFTCEDLLRIKKNTDPVDTEEVQAQRRMLSYLCNLWSLSRRKEFIFHLSSDSFRRSPPGKSSLYRTIVSFFFSGELGRDKNNLGYFNRGFSRWQTLGFVGNIPECLQERVNFDHDSQRHQNSCLIWKCMKETISPTSADWLLQRLLPSDTAASTYKVSIISIIYSMIFSFPQPIFFSHAFPTTCFFFLTGKFSTPFRTLRLCFYFIFLILLKFPFSIQRLASTKTSVCDKSVWKK